VSAVLTTPLNLAAAPQGLVTVPPVTTARSQSQAEQWRATGAPVLVLVLVVQSISDGGAGEGFWIPEEGECGEC
jgi:hypothetical protein